MKQKLFWLDLAFCSLWAISVVGSHMFMAEPMDVLMVVALMARINFSFSLYRGDKCSWIPLSLLWGMSIMMIVCGYPIGVRELCIYPFYFFNVEFNRTLAMWLSGFGMIWFYIIPVIWYFVCRFKKKLSDTGLTWKEGLGAILWKEESAKAYIKLLSASIGATYIGLATSPGLSNFACLVLPALSLYVLAKYHHVQLQRIWVMPVSMSLFLIAQTYGGAWRIILLVVSLFLVGYLCYISFCRNKRLVTLSVIALLYHGVILPSLILGYNQYTCIDYAYHGQLESFSGIFKIKDPKTGLIGLRDRYKLLITPAYDDMAFHGSNHLWGELELRKNGYYDLYQIANNRFSDNSGIEQNLQDKIFPLIGRHMEYFRYNYNDRLEVIVTEYETNTRITHLKSCTKASEVIYDYQEKSYIVPDTATILSGNFKDDSLVVIDQWIEKQVRQYSYDVMNDSIPQFNILVKIARDVMPRERELLELTGSIEEKVMEWKEGN